MTGSSLSRIYRPVYALVFIGSGLYQMYLLKGRLGTLVSLLALWLILTGVLMLLPVKLRQRLSPGFLGRSQTAALALWTAVPFLGLGSALLLDGQNPPLALTGIAAGILMTIAALLLRKKARNGDPS